MRGSGGGITDARGRGDNMCGGAVEGNIGTLSLLTRDKSRLGPVHDAITPVFDET